MIGKEGFPSNILSYFLWKGGDFSIRKEWTGLLIVQYYSLGSETWN